MAYKLEKPCTKEQRIKFIVEYNHKLGLKIEETDSAFYALEQNENMENDVPVINLNYEKEQAEEEKKRIAMLSLTKREIFLALYKAKGLKPEDIRNKITDIEALIEFDYANSYYRGNPLVDKIGELLGYSSKDLDFLFINKVLPTLQGE